MAFDDSTAPAESSRLLSVAPCGDGWAIKHGDGFLGMSADREEAMRLLRTLQQAAAEALPRAR